MLLLTKEDASILLNNIDKLEDAVDNTEKSLKLVFGEFNNTIYHYLIHDLSLLYSQQVEASVFLYRRLERQNVLKGFNCIDGQYPDKSTEVSPTRLEETTGYNIIIIILLFLNILRLKPKIVIS